MIDIIPELEIIIGNVLLQQKAFINFSQGPQPPVPNVGAVETLHRFKEVLTSFVFSLACKRHPLVIFLDDLQCKFFKIEIDLEFPNPIY